MIKMTVGKKKSKQARRESLNLPASNFLTKVNRFKKLQRTIARLSPSWQACIPIAAIIVLAWGYAAVAQTAPAPTTEEQLASLKVGMDTMWVMVAGMLVFFMNAGFCMLETGFCRQKNAVNVLSKNLIVFALSTIAFWAIGFALMFSNGNGFYRHQRRIFSVECSGQQPRHRRRLSRYFQLIKLDGSPPQR